MLVDHVQELQPPAIGGGIELEVHGPDLMRVCGLMAPHGAVGGPCPLLLSGSGPLKALLPPDPLHPLVIHTPALSPQHAVGHPPAPADVLGGDLPQPLPEFGLLEPRGAAAMALGAAVLAHNPTGEPLRCPVTLLQDNHRPAPAFRAQKFPSARSFSIAFSSSASASSFYSCGEAFG